MRPLLHACRHGAGFCFHCCCSFLCWSLWLALSLLLAGQVWIATTHTLELPGPLLRHLEGKAAALGLTLRCERVIFTPSGHLQVENFTVGTPAFTEPIVRGRLLRTRIDPWGALVGYEETRHISLSGVEIWVPAPLSPSGMAEPLIQGLDSELHVTRREWTIEQLSFRCASAMLFVTGRLPVDFIMPSQPRETLQGNAWLQPALNALRKAAELRPQLNAVENARMELNIQPRTEKTLRIDANAWMERLRLTNPLPIETGPLSIRAQVALGTARQPFVLDVKTTSLAVRDVSATNLSARIRGAWPVGESRPTWRLAEAAAEAVFHPRTTLEKPVLRIEHDATPVLRLQGAAALAGSPVEVRATIDENTMEGQAALNLSVTSELIGWVGGLIGTNLLPYANPLGPTRLRGEVEWNKDKKLRKAEGWLEATSVAAYNVGIDYARGFVCWDGRTFLASPAYARIGDSHAHGSYGMDANTREFRFLLEGQLHPPAISGWFREWWPRFWSSFNFSAELPQADVDVQGQWGAGHRTSVFIGAEGRRSVIREISLERARTRIFVRPNFTDVIEGIAERTEGTARGWFRRTFDPQADAWRSVEFDIVSTVEPAEAARLFGQQGARVIAPYTFEHTPEVRVRGRIDGPAAPEGVKEALSIDVRSRGGFTVSDFPLQDVSFEGRLEAGDLTLTRITARAGRGSIEAIARVWGPPGERKLAFGGHLTGANLGETIRTVDAYLAKKSGRPAEKAVVQDKLGDTRLDLTVSAEGPYLDPMEFTGKGSAKLSGATLGELKLLGLLSELLPFTSLRFTQAASDFTIDRNQLVFPAVRITGHNSAIDANGRYLLDRKQLDFHAKVWPFDQSKNIVQGAMGLVLSPLSQALEVKLEGSLSQPKWSFAFNPFGILRSIASGAAAEEPQRQNQPSLQEKPPAEERKPPVSVPAP